MRIMHISEDRFNTILQQGQRLPVGGDGSIASVYSGRTVYHLLDGDEGYCNRCEAVFSSPWVSIPVELEDFKLRQTGAAN